MDNHYRDKALSLAKALSRRPAWLVPWVRYLPLWGRQPIDLEQPWVSFGAIEFLDGHLQRFHSVLELGGGGSTIYFGRRAGRVLTIENDPGWHRAVVAAIAARRLDNVSCELHEIPGDRPAQFEDCGFFHRLLQQKWDLIFIDCYCGFSASRYGEIRPHALQLAFAQLNPGGIIVLDDSWMYRPLLSPRAGWRITDYVGPGPCRYGVTSTAIFERLP